MSRIQDDHHHRTDSVSEFGPAVVELMERADALGWVMLKHDLNKNFKIRMLVFEMAATY